MSTSFSVSVGVHFTVFEGDAVGYLLHVVSGEVLVEIYVIYLLLEELGMGQFASQLAVVGEQKHTNRGAGKTTHGVDALGASVLDEVHHGLALLGVIHCGDIVLGLVEQHVHLLLDGHGLVVGLHLVLGLIPISEPTSRVDGWRMAGWGCNKK